MWTRDPRGKPSYVRLGSTPTSMKGRLMGQNVFRLTDDMIERMVLDEAAAEMTKIWDYAASDQQRAFLNNESVRDMITDMYGVELPEVTT